jgi:hypothetical protein
MVLPLRSLPFVGYALLARTLHTSVRIGAVAAFVAAAALAVKSRAGALDDMTIATLVFGYFVAWSALVHVLCGCLDPRFVRGGGLLLASTFALIVVPAFAVTHRAIVPMLVVGWEIALSAHSYGVETAGRSRPSLREGLFFLIVNPTVVYPERGRVVGRPRLELRAIARILIGSVTMLGRDVVLLGVATLPWLRVADLSEIDGVASYARFVGTHLLLGLGLYCAHSGLASIHIGWMRLLGYELSERYVFPFASVSPQDFWRRWNTWIGRWAHHYLFVPVTRGAQRRWQWSFAPAIGAVCAFVGVGLLHDVGAWGLRMRQSTRGLPLKFAVVFLAFGVAFLAWRRVSPHVARLLRAVPPPARAVLSWCACLQLVAFFSWLAMPVLRSYAWPSFLTPAP